CCSCCRCGFSSYQRLSALAGSKTHNKGELLDKWEAEIFANIQADYLYR
uniref:Uncharacterized protein n=1 Tax=Oncorhynchus kisutch TaxID=8019 RepID=A0A8C7FUY8_ONCKI